MAVADQLGARFGAVSVRGELAGFSRAPSGHCYFSLKDADGQAGLLRCAMFRRAAALLAALPADGQQVELRGRLAVYEARGELQMVVESLQVLGAGDLYEQFLRLRARLQAEGLFDPQRRRALPAHPRTLGVVTSPSAAAWHDVMTTLRRRSPHVRVILYPSLVQGPQAPGELVAALATAALRARADALDALLLVRGGGSLEDLWAFNDERVVRAVAAFPLPLVCGVGHETDISLCDLAADVRAATPTAAAELAAPSCEALRQETAALARRLSLAAQRLLDQRGQRLDLLALRVGRPSSRLGAEQQRLRSLALRLANALRRRVESPQRALPAYAQRLAWPVRHALQRHQDRLTALAQRLQAAHPQHVLARGFAWVSDAQGAPITHAARLKVGDDITAVLADGTARATVRELHQGGAAQ